jgi:hypothetical protein
VSRSEGTTVELTLDRPIFSLSAVKADADVPSPRQKAPSPAPSPRHSVFTYTVSLQREPALRGALAAATRNLGDSEVEALFGHYDTDGSGMIDTRELQAVLRRLGFEATSSEVAQMLGQADLDHNHGIDIREFRLLIGRNREKQ